MNQTYETKLPNATPLERATAISAGDVSIAVRGELTRLLATNDGDRKNALTAGFDELVARQSLTRAEATDLAAIFDQLFDAPHETDSELSQRVRAYYRRVILDPRSSPAALAITSVVNSLLSTDSTSTGKSTERAVSKGDVLYGSFGAVIGAGIGAGFGGPVGAGIGAVVGAAVGVCIERG